MARRILDRRSLLLLVSGLVVLSALSFWRLGRLPLTSSTAPAGILGTTMGTTYSVRLGGARADQLEQARSAVREALDDVDRATSTYREDSELGQIEHAAVGVPVHLSPIVFDVLDVAERVGRETGGAFDVTVGPLVSLWGFGAQAGEGTPDAAEVAAAKARVGWSHLRLDREAHTLTLLRPDLRLDAGGVAKGYAVDHASEALTALGLRDHLVEVGGEVRVAGRSADGHPWRVGIEQPREDGSRAVGETLSLTDGCAATSGDYRNFRETDEGRVSHIVDPRTGRPVPSRVATVTVVRPTCAEADALATALTVLGPEAGIALADARGWEVRMGLHADGDLVVRTSRAFREAHPEACRDAADAPSSE